MGLFSFVGKAVGGLAHVVGGVAKLGVGALRSGLLPIPLGGTAGKLLGGLLHAKAPLGHSQLKLSIPPLVLRGKTLRPSVTIGTSHGAVTRPTITALRKSPVMPGGSIATPRGVQPRPLGLQSGARSLTASGKPKKRRRRRASSSSRSSYRTSRGRSKRRTTHKRRLKFGSPAWRKKYLGHGRKRRKRRAA
jgi:hypothetical protein